MLCLTTDLYLQKTEIRTYNCSVIYYFITGSYYFITGSCKQGSNQAPKTPDENRRAENCRSEKPRTVKFLGQLAQLGADP